MGLLNKIKGLGRFMPKVSYVAVAAAIGVMALSNPAHAKQKHKVTIHADEIAEKLGQSGTLQDYINAVGKDAKNEPVRKNRSHAFNTYIEPHAQAAVTFSESHLDGRVGADLIGALMHADGTPKQNRRKLLFTRGADGDVSYNTPLFESAARVLEHDLNKRNAGFLKFEVDIDYGNVGLKAQAKTKPIQQKPEEAQPKIVAQPIIPQVPRQVRGVEAEVRTAQRYSITLEAPVVAQPVIHVPRIVRRAETEAGNAQRNPITLEAQIDLAEYAANKAGEISQFVTESTNAALSATDKTFFQVGETIGRTTSALEDVMAYADRVIANEAQVKEAIKANKEKSQSRRGIETKSQSYQVAETTTDHNSQPVFDADIFERPTHVVDEDGKTYRVKTAQDYGTQKESDKPAKAKSTRAKPVKKVAQVKPISEDTINVAGLTQSPLSINDLRSSKASSGCSTTPGNNPTNPVAPLALLTAMLGGYALLRNRKQKAAQFAHAALTGDTRSAHLYARNMSIDQVLDTRDVVATAMSSRLSKAKSKAFAEVAYRKELQARVENNDAGSHDLVRLHLLGAEYAFANELMSSMSAREIRELNEGTDYKSITPQSANKIEQVIANAVVGAKKRAYAAQQSTQAQYAQKLQAQANNSIGTSRRYSQIQANLVAGNYQSALDQMQGLTTREITDLEVGLDATRLTKNARKDISKIFETAENYEIQRQQVETKKPTYRKMIQAAASVFSVFR